MSWNYRVQKKKAKLLNDRWETEYGIVESYEKHGVTEDFMQPISESVEGLRTVLGLMLEACDKPVLGAEPQEEEQC